MTQEQQDKLRRALYNAKFTTDAYDENPFVGIYFNDLLDIIHDFGQQRPQWIPVDKELPKKKGAYLFHFDDGQTRVEGYFPELHLSKCVTHWAEIVPPEED